MMVFSRGSSSQSAGYGWGCYLSRAEELLTVGPETGNISGWPVSGALEMGRVYLTGYPERL
jgi:hypothetical protein